MKLSIGMIVRNESKYLERCLNALKPIIENIESELIIVDTGSTDNTVEIAKRFTNKVFFYQWKDDFAEARNITIDKSRGEWYFYIDADEILENVESIIEFFNKSIYKKYKALAVQIKNLADDKGNIGSTFYSKRIVKKDNGVRFKSRIHEQLPSREPVYLSNSVFIHYGYINTDKELMHEKFKRNSCLIRKELENDPNNIYLLYHLSKTYNLHGENTEALQAIQKAYQTVKKANTYPLWICNLVVNMCIENGLFREAEKIAEESIQAQHQQTTSCLEIYFYLAQVQARLNKNGQAIESYKEYLRLLELYEENQLRVDYNEVFDLGGKLFVYEQIAVLYDGLLDFHNAMLFIKKTIDLFNEEEIESKQYLNKAFSYIVKLCIKYKEYDQIVASYIEIIDQMPENIKHEIENNFIVSLESSIKNSISHKKEIIKRFSRLNINTSYIFLNKLREKVQKSQNITEEDGLKIREFSFHEQIGIYGEFIYHLLRDLIDVTDIISKINEKEMNRYMEYIVYTFSDFSTVISNYFQKYKDKKDISYCVFSKAFKRAILIQGEIDDRIYFNLFNRYVKEGIFYLEKVYKENILEEENIYILKSYEEIFFMYMRKAFKYKETDEIQYLQYLRKALSSYDYMKKGIEFFLEEVKQEKIETSLENSRYDEFEKYKETVKKNIKILLETEKIAEAKVLIDEYLKIVPSDLEMLILKSEVQLQLI
ncbi:glycosyl transferase family 2 [Clostridium aceticum]|uniref:Glycosyl transferase family 2 n=1 Tax=Clostridium aceticum TaxID=84022 RepID=A0A0D8I6W4_9CLOT|nr:glycosyltransferase [Clostridium aceticum]AKL93776.1 glycosyl transferase family 2 [Clostridium aceticum]KJF25814.1 hypothetical protein TZ02_16570 [Clostridium aceticum]